MEESQSPALSSERNVTRFICEVGGGEIIAEVELFVSEIFNGGNTALPLGAAAAAAAAVFARGDRGDPPLEEGPASFIGVSIGPNKSAGVG